MQHLPLAPTKFEKAHPATTYSEAPALAEPHRNTRALPVPVVGIPTTRVGMASMPNVMGGLKAPKTKPNYGMAHPVTYKMKTFDELEYTD
jgi:hypothetical protein